MMRKGIILCLVFLILVLYGCEKQDNQYITKRVVTLAKDETNSGLVLFLDEDNEVLAEKEINYPYAFFYDDNYIYYSEDGSNYESLNFQSFMPGKRLKNVSGGIIAVSGNDYFADVSGGLCLFKADGTEYAISVYASCAYKGDDYFYYIDNSNNFHACSLDDFSEVSTEKIEDSNLFYFTRLDGKIYLVNDRGVTSVDGDKLGSTYVFRNDFKEIKNVIGSLIWFEEKDETVAYVMSVDKYKLVLTPEYNENYYRAIRFEEEFKKYYADGYYVVDYYELGY